MEVRRILVAAGSNPHGRSASRMAARLSRRPGSALRRIAPEDPEDEEGEIAEAARAWGAELLVLAAPEPESEDATASAPSRLPMRVGISSPCPVLVTRAGHDRFAPRGLGFRRPVVGVDHAAFSPLAARAAIALTEPDGAVDLLHVFSRELPGESMSPGLERPAASPATEEARFRELQRLFAFADRVDSPSVAVECHVEMGDPAHQLLEHIARGQNDLCVLGAHSRITERERALGTVTGAVLRQAPVPVLLIPEALLGDA